MKKSFTKPFILTATSMLLCGAVIAQDAENLVVNGSFEDANTRKLRRIGKIELAEGWSSATGVKADLFSADAGMPEIQTSSNIYGGEEPKDGINYAGIIAYSYREKENRTYITSELKSPLKKGMRYQVQFYASLAELSKYSANRLGIHFSKKSPHTDQKVQALILETNVEHPEKEIFDGLYGWDLVCAEYVATGKEKYITIGNFSNPTEVKNERVRKPRNVRGTQIIAAYYYIDDISVRLLDPNEKCDCNYADKTVVETQMLYQRAPEITEKMTTAQKLEEYQIYYSNNRYDVRRDGQITLDKIVEMLNADPNLKIQVTGHADSKEASNAATQNIASKRAEYIKTLLIEDGIADHRIEVITVNDNQPSKYITDTDGEELINAKNRRVTFTQL